MKSIILFSFLFVLMLYGCGQKAEFLTQQEIDVEKENVKKVIIDFNKANDERDFGKMIEYLSDEVIFFGTDSSEVFKTFAEYKKAIDQQWKEYEKIIYGDLQDFTIFIDPQGNLATIFYGTNATVTKQGQTSYLYLRVSRVLEKKDNKWLIKGGLTGIVRNYNQFNSDTTN